MTLLDHLRTVAARPDIQMDLSVYKAGVLDQILAPIEQYLAAAPRLEKRGLFGWGKKAEPQRVSPLLLSGPVGTGKTTLMMLLDRALPNVSCTTLFQQEIPGHPSTADATGRPAMIEVRPLALMGKQHNIETGVIRLRELQTFYRLYAYDRRTLSFDSEAAERFAQLFRRRIVFIDEFVPDKVTAFPMQVINHLADHGVLVVLTSNRKETPFVEGVQIVTVEGDDMRTGELARVVRPAGVDPRFDAARDLPPSRFDFIVSGLQGRLVMQGERTWLYIRYSDIERVPADWLAFQRLLQHTEGVLIDEVPLFDPAITGSADGARRFVFLIDAIYDERRPVLVRITNAEPLDERFDVDTLKDSYLPEVLLDLERALSRLRQLASLPT